MGFISLLVADAAIAGVLAVVIGLLALAALLAVVGIVTSVVFAAGTERRRAQGKRLGAKVAIPITCLVFSGLIMGGLFVAKAALDASYAPTQLRNDVHSRVTSDDIAGLDALLDAHPEFSIDDDEGGERWTLLQTAVRCDEPDMVDHLLARGADANAGAQDDGDESNVPLMLAVDWQTYGPFAEEDKGICSGHDGYDPEVVLALLDAGADANPTTVYRMGASPLQLLCTAMFGDGLDETDATVVQAMIDHGASLSYENGNGKRAVDIFEENLTADWAQVNLTTSDPAVIAELRTLLTPTGTAA